MLRYGDCPRHPVPVRGCCLPADEPKPDPPKPAFVEETAKKLLAQLQAWRCVAHACGCDSQARGAEMLKAIAAALEAAARGRSDQDVCPTCGTARGDVGQLAEARAATQKAHSAAADALMVFEQRAQKAEQALAGARADWAAQAQLARDRLDVIAAMEERAEAAEERARQAAAEERAQILPILCADCTERLAAR